MATAVTFLKNYRQFGRKVRILTAQTYLEKLQLTQDVSEKKVMMLRITEELIASSEDLTMWLAGLKQKEAFNNNIDNIWDYLLVTSATEEQIEGELKNLARARTGMGLYKKFNLPSIDYLARFAKTDKDTILSLFMKLLEVIKASLHNRTARRKVMQRFHNKVKHGMVIQDYGSNLYIRDYKLPTSTKRRSNRHLYLDLEEDRFKKMVGTIEATTSVIDFIVSLFLADYGSKIEKRRMEGKKISKKEMRFLKDSLIDYSK